MNSNRNKSRIFCGVCQKHQPHTSSHTDKGSEKKRKRLRNTTVEQYALYLQVMEENYIFRSNTINPALDPNYLNNIWSELCIKLNLIGNGPALTVEEWKKRFTDWKYATKAKYRKINEHAKQIDAEPKLNLELTPLEERGLCVWRNVTEPATNVTICDRVSATETGNGVVSKDIVFPFEDVILTCQPHSIKDDEILIEPLPSTSDEDPLLNSKAATDKVHRERRRRPKLLSNLAKNLIKSSISIDSTNNELSGTIKNFCEEYIKIENEKLELENEKFKFEIAKFKFLNKDFNF